MYWSWLAYGWLGVGERLTGLQEFDVSIGPLAGRVKVAPPYVAAFETRMQGFAAKQTAGSSLSLSVDLGARSVPRSLPVQARSDEVHLEADMQDGLLALSATLAMTPRALLRRMKRIAQKEHWRQGRWSLLLRNGFELPTLALLEYQHGLVPVHAATLSGSRGAIMLLGHNGAGKSTLATRLIDEFALDLISDNFSPSDGSTVVSFPGPPRSKPGDDLPQINPINATREVRAIVAVGMDLPRGQVERTAHLAQYLNHDFDAHRGTGWEKLVGGDDAEGQSRANSLKVAAVLAGLPYMSYDRFRDAVPSVLAFVRQGEVL